MTQIKVTKAMLAAGRARINLSKRVVDDVGLTSVFHAMVAAAPKPKPPRSRPDRWVAACAGLTDRLEELVAIQEEYQEWRDGLPENLEGSALAEKLDAVCDLDLETVRDTVSEAEAADLPLGFGRD